MNSDTLRRAVELADGVIARDYHDNGLYLCITDDQPASCIVDRDEMNLPQWFIDALAAQLVRQVKALGRSFAITDQQTRIWPRSADVPVLRTGDDPGENTINAIVDSGVLE